MHDSTEAAGPHPLRCPLCGVCGLEERGHCPERCSSCGALLGQEILKTLRQIADLPEAVGRHACECGHPEMRRLPDGVFHCPACGAEVLPVGSFPFEPRGGTAMGKRRGIGGSATGP